MQIKPIPDKEAAKLIGVTYETIRNAVKRGDLTRIPQAGLVQHVAKEQVILFTGKKQLKMANLSKEDRRQWEEIDDAIKGKTSSTQSTEPKVATMPLFNLDRSALEYLDERKLTMRAETAAGTMSFHSALIDEPVTDSNEDEQDTYGEWVNSLNEAVAILLGLVLLLFVLYLTKREASKQAEQTIEKIGLEREDLATNQREAIEKLRSHPVEAQKLRRILEKEDLLVA